MQEIWRDIKGYEGLYQVSNLGNVKSLNYNHTGKAKILKLTIHNGYYRCNLYNNGKMKSYRVNRIVCKTFKENKHGKIYVNHKDGNKLNNRIENLEWCTGSENIKHAYKNNLINHYTIKVNQYDLQGNFIRTWNSVVEIENFYNKRMHIVDCCEGKRKTAYGYKWKYKDIA